MTILFTGGMGHDSLLLEHLLSVPDIDLRI